MFTDSSLILLQTGTTYINHTLIFTPGAFKCSNYYPSLNLIGHIHIPTPVTKTMPEWPDPPFRHAGDVIHPVLQKGVVWFTRLVQL